MSTLTDLRPTCLKTSKECNRTPSVLFLSRPLYLVTNCREKKMGRRHSLPLSLSPFAVFSPPPPFALVGRRLHFPLVQVHLTVDPTQPEDWVTVK